MEERTEVISARSDELAKDTECTAGLLKRKRDPNGSHELDGCQKMGGMPGLYHSCLISCLIHSVVGWELCGFQVDRSQVKCRGKGKGEFKPLDLSCSVRRGKRQIQKMDSGLFLKSEILIHTL